MLTEARAVEIAEAAHAGQTDKAGRPYIDHPKRVMGKFSDPELRIIAVLHDAIEDSALTILDLHTMGASLRVRSALEAITHPKGEPNEVYWARVKENPDAHMVKIEDIRDNLDGERLASLPIEVSSRLIQKYARALLALGVDTDDVADWSMDLARHIQAVDLYLLGVAYLDDRDWVPDRPSLYHVPTERAFDVAAADHVATWIQELYEALAAGLVGPARDLRAIAAKAGVSGGSQTGEPG